VECARGIGTPANVPTVTPSVTSIKSCVDAAIAELAVSR
jgi:hypothetical protein